MNKLTIRLPDEELQILKQYAEQTSRTQTEILRSYIRTLKSRVKPTNPA
ncbi:ribbon-helix-helix protein, CopG family [Microseira sp. BLCC-F43]|jgi:predicted DNA-binding protein